MEGLQLPDLDRFSVHFTVYFKPEDAPIFLEAMRGAVAAVTEEKECLYFELYEYPDEPGKFSWIENWEGSPEWFLNVRFPSKYEIYKPYLEATEPLFIKPREVKFLKRVGTPFILQRPENAK